MKIILRPTFTPVMEIIKYRSKLRTLQSWKVFSHPEPWAWMEWAAKNQEKLLTNWSLAQDNQPLLKIAPLE